MNEFKAFKADVAKKIDDAVAKWAESQIAAAERITKLEGELRAMKARQGKIKQD